MSSDLCPQCVSVLKVVGDYDENDGEDYDGDDGDIDAHFDDDAGN